MTYFTPWRSKGTVGLDWAIAGLFGYLWLSRIAPRAHFRVYRLAR
jgi:hypothetical protein